MRVRVTMHMASKNARKLSQVTVVVVEHVDMLHACTCTDMLQHTW
jgi:hypothetical protein